MYVHFRADKEGSVSYQIKRGVCLAGWTVRKLQVPVEPLEIGVRSSLPPYVDLLLLNTISLITIGNRKETDNQK